MVISKKSITKHIELIKTDDNKRYFRWYGRDLLTFADFKDEFKWRKRNLKHTISRNFIIWLFRNISYWMAKQMIKKFSEEEKRELLHPSITIEYNGKGYNTGNKYDTRKYNYKLNFLDIRILGYNEAELYGKFITLVILQPYSFPWC